MPYQYVDTLLSNLTESEKQSVHFHLLKKNEEEDTLVLKYLNNILDKSSSSVSGNFEGNRMLRSRAFDRVEDILTSNYHIDKKENFSSHDQVLLRLKKRVLLARIISKSLNQNRIGPLKTILNIIITDAKKNEVYEVLIEALNLKKYFFALKAGSHEFEKIEKEISFYEMCQKKVYFSSDCYFKLVINTNLLKFKTDKAFHNYILKTIRLLKIDYQKYRSAQINYYLHIIQMFYYEKKRKYTLAAKYCNTLISILHKNPIVYRTERVGFALLNLSQYKTFTRKLSDAARCAKEAQKYYLENSNNYLISKEQEFLIYFYHKKYEKAHDCLRELLDQKLVDSGNFNHAKYIYYQSVLLFVQKKYKQALPLLNKSLEIEKDKARWNVSLKIMNIMLLIELNKIDDASRLLESLRKYIQRHTKSHDIKTRDVLIVKLLRDLERDGFDYKTRNKAVTKGLITLSQKNKVHSWEYYSPELIPFHEWLVTKKN